MWLGPKRRALNSKTAPNAEIDEKTARLMALEKLGLSRVTEDVLVGKYQTFKNFKKEYREVAKYLHTDHKNELGPNPMIALNKIRKDAELIFKARAAREQKEKTEKRNEWE